MSDSQIKTISEHFRWFARLEAAGRSPLYESLAPDIAQDDAILKFLSTRPVKKRPSNSANATKGTREAKLRPRSWPTPKPAVIWTIYRAS